MLPHHLLGTIGTLKGKGTPSLQRGPCDGRSWGRKVGMEAPVQRKPNTLAAFVSYHLGKKPTGVWTVGGLFCVLTFVRSWLLFLSTSWNFDFFVIWAFTFESTGPRTSPVTCTLLKIVLGYHNSRLQSKHLEGWGRRIALEASLGYIVSFKSMLSKPCLRQ